MKKILFISPLANACTYYRCTLPARHLGRQGLAETRVVSSIAKEYIDWADVIIVQRVVGDMMYHVIKYARLEGKKVVYELDDNIFKYPDSPEYVRKGLQAETLSAIRIIRSVDAVTTSTEPIAETVRGLADTPAYVLPNQIDFADMEDMKPAAPRQPSVGWMGGHYHVQDLALVEAALEVILKKNPDLVLIMYGACPQGLYERNKTRVFLQPFMPMEEFHFWMASLRFDVGIAPLYKTEFALSRSNLRLLQYAAMKIPVVASNYGEYGKALGNGLAGVTAEDDQWVDRIGYLLERPDERQGLAEVAHDYVRENYDMASNAHRWSDVYREVMDG